MNKPAAKPPIPKFKTEAQERAYWESHDSTWVVGRLFLAINGQKLVFDPLDAIHFMLAVAAGNMTQAQTAQWIRQRLAPELAV
jgi:hypothetical protein